MQPQSGRPTEPNGEPLLPPASTRWRPIAESGEEAVQPIAPFIPSRAQARTAAPAEPVASDPAPWEPQRAPAIEPAPASPEPVPSSEEEAEPFELLPQVDPWASHEPPGAGEFPLEAFYVPEAASSIPTGVHPHDELAEHLAQRLEALAQQLRRTGFGALIHPHSGEPIDTILAALLSGYLAAGGR